MSEDKGSPPLANFGLGKCTWCKDLAVITSNFYVHWCSQHCEWQWTKAQAVAGRGEFTKEVKGNTFFNWRLTNDCVSKDKPTYPAKHDSK